MKNRIAAREKQVALVKLVMERMEKEGFDKEDAETFPEVLATKIKENNERFEKEKPFAIFRD